MTNITKKDINDYINELEIYKQCFKELCEIIQHTVNHKKEMKMTELNGYVIELLNFIEDNRNEN
jgi:hypothetical protein